MSRKDTIIVAVLVNAGLLIVLFASALKSNVSGPEAVVQAAVQPQAIQEPVAKVQAPHLGGDEVDHVLQQYAHAPTAVVASSVTQEPVAVVNSSALTPAQPNFAEDLKLFSVAEAPKASLTQSPLRVEPKESDESVAEFIEVKVKKGDMLEKLARYHQTTVSEIMTINQLNNTNLKIGQVLKIANKSAKGKNIISQSPSHSTVPAAELRNEDSAPQYYTVQKGDNPWTIAVKNHMKVADLLKLNNMSEDQARRIKPGDQLRIR